MSTFSTRNSNSLAWFVVAVAGVVVLVIVWGLELHDRLDAGQRVVDGARPIFVEERVQGDRVGITMISNVSDTYDPIIDEEGGAAGEVGPLVELVAGATGLPPEDVLAALEENFPHTYHLLLTLPLDQVSAEVPALLNFVAENSELADGDEVLSAIAANTPHLAQAIGNLLVVTENWRDVEGMDGTTRFDDVTPVQSVPEIRDLFETDVITAVEVAAPDFRDLDKSNPEVGQIAWILTVIGVIVVILGIVMMLVSRSSVYGRGVHIGTWSLVVLVGFLVGAVLASILWPRLDSGQKAIDELRPVFVEERIVGMEVGIDIVGNIGDLSDPIIDEQGGAAGEVGALVELVAGATGLPAEDVLAALEENFPHTYHLLLTLPLDQVSAEVPALLNFVADNSDLEDAEAVLGAIAANTPNLAQAIGNLLVVTDGFREIPGLDQLTRFDDVTPVRSIPEVIAYFDDDVVATVRDVAVDFRTVDTTAPPANVFPPLLLILGILVVIYGGAMLFLTGPYTPRREEPDGGGSEPSEPAGAEPSDRALETAGSTSGGGS